MMILRLLPCLLAAVFPLSAQELAKFVHDDDVNSAAFSPDGSRVATASDDGTVKVWPSSRDRLPMNMVVDEATYASSVAFSPDGRILAGGQEDASVRIWNPATGQQIAVFKGHEDAVTSIAFSRDGRFLASGSGDSTIRIWELPAGKEVAVLRGHEGEVRSVAFSPDSSLLASGANDGKVILWDPASWKPALTFSEHTESVNSVAFSQDGKLLACGADDGAVSILEVPGGKVRTTLKGTTGAALSVAFSPSDSRRLASCDVLGNVIFWDVPAGTEQTRFQAHDRLVTSVAYSSDGRLVSASFDGTAKLWDPVKAVNQALFRDKADGIYLSLYESARFLDRQQGLIAADTQVEGLELVFKKAEESVGNDHDTLRSSLSELVITKRTADFDLAKNENYISARKMRDSLFRNLLVMKAVCDFAQQQPGSVEAKRQLAQGMISKWTGLAQDYLGSYYASLANNRISPQWLEEDTTWYRQMRFTARRNVITADELLKAAPDPAALQHADDESRDRFWMNRAAFLCYESRFDQVLDICRTQVKANPELAVAIARQAVTLLALDSDQAGRSERGMAAAEAFTARQFSDFIKTLKGIEGLTLDTRIVPEYFAKFCSYSSRRPVRRQDLEALITPLEKCSESEMAAYVEKLLFLLGDVKSASPKGKEPTKKIKDQENYATVISSEYDALDTVLAAWQKGRVSWRGDQLRAEVRFAWADHQLRFVEIKPERKPGAPPEGRSEASNTDADGFRKHTVEWKESIRSSAEGFLADSSLDDATRAMQGGDLLSSWFHVVMELAATPAYRKQSGEDLLSDIRTWLERLPEKTRGPLLDAFARDQLQRIDPPPSVLEQRGEDFRIPNERKFAFAEAVSSLARDSSAGRIFADLLDEYEKLRAGIHFYAIPEGEMYDSGAWSEVKGTLATVPVDSGEFGIWFTLVHTDEAWEVSGGFRRYSQNASVAASYEWNSLSETERAKYAEDFKKYLAAELSESFEVVIVAPHPHPDVRREFERADSSVWKETPLYHAILRPKGNTPASSIPVMQMDLDFPHPLGRVVLPFKSPKVPLRSEHGKATHLREVKIDQFLDDTQRAQGDLVLTIVSESHGVPPPPQRMAASLPPEGFALDDTRTHSVFEVKDFPTGTTAALIKRTTTYHLNWLGSGIATAFRFPAYTAPAGSLPWQVDSFLKRPGQIQERYVKDGVVDLYGLPWHWESALQWLSKTFKWAVIILGCALLIWLIAYFIRRTARPAAPIFPLSRPTTDTPLASANFLRCILREKSASIPLSHDKEQGLREDIEYLENLDPVKDDAGLAAEALAMTNKWLEIARKCFEEGLKQTDSNSSKAWP